MVAEETCWHLVTVCFPALQLLLWSCTIQFQVWLHHATAERISEKQISMPPTSSPIGRSLIICLSSPICLKDLLHSSLWNVGQRTVCFQICSVPTDGDITQQIFWRWTPAAKLTGSLIYAGPRQPSCIFLVCWQRSTLSTTTYSWNGYSLSGSVIKWFTTSHRIYPSNHTQFVPQLAATSCIVEVSWWMMFSRLQLNPSKTDVLSCDAPLLYVSTRFWPRQHASALQTCCFTPLFLVPVIHHLWLTYGMLNSVYRLRMDSYILALLI